MLSFKRVQVQLNAGEEKTEKIIQDIYYSKIYQKVIGLGFIAIFVIQGR